MRIAEAFVELRVDSKGAQADVRKQAQSLGSTFAQVFGAAAFGAGLKRAIDEGSRLEQSVGAIDAIFGEAGKTIDQWAKDAARNMGLAESEAREALTLIGAQLKNFGFDVEEARDKGQILVELAADLAATFGGTTVEAIEALTAALRGEMDPIERYGVSLNDARLKAKALELGLYSGKGALDANAKASASLALITEQTAAAQGQFARELDTVAGRQAVAAAEAKNSAASLGQNLAPVYERLVDLVGFLANGFGALPAPLQYATVGLLAVAAFAGPFGTLKTSIVNVTTAIRNMGTTGRVAVGALGALAGIITVAMIAYGDYAKAKQEAEERTRTFTDALRAEADGQADAVKAAIAHEIATGDLADRIAESGVAMEDVARFIRGESVPALDRLVQLYARGAGPLSNFALLTQETGEFAGMTAVELKQLAGLIVQQRDAYSGAVTQMELYDEVGRELGLTTEEVATATDKSADALYDQADAASASERAIADLESAFSGLLDTLDDRDAVRNMQQSFDDLQQKALDAWYAAASGSADAEQAQRDYQQAVDDAKREVIEFAKEIGDIPPEAVSEIIALIDEGKLAEAEAKLAALERERRVMFSAVLDPSTDQITIGKTGQVRLMAMGGVVRKATPAIVGEAGTEAVLPLTRPERMAQILSDPEVAGPVAAAMGGGGGGDITIQLVVNDRAVQAITARQSELRKGSR